MNDRKEQTQQAYFGSGAPLQATTGFMTTSPCVCPTCGTCPTCGQRRNITYPYTPLHGPQWTYTNGGQTVQGVDPNKVIYQGT